MVLHVTKILGAKRTLLSKDVRCRYQCEMSVLSGKNMHPPRKSNLHYFAGASTGSSCMVGYGQKDMNPVNYCEPVFMNPNRRRSFPQFLTRLQGGHECNHCNPKINSVFFWVLGCSPVDREAECNAGRAVTTLLQGSACKALGYEVERKQFDRLIRMYEPW